MDGIKDKVCSSCFWFILGIIAVIIAMGSNWWGREQMREIICGDIDFYVINIVRDKDLVRLRSCEENRPLVKNQLPAEVKIYHGDK